MTEADPHFSPPEPRRGPVAAVIAVVLHEGRTLLVRRANPPDAGLWGFPGGKIDHGETIEDAALRELREETGVRGEARRVFGAVDVFDRDAAGGLRRHFVLIAVLCRWVAGEPVAADDALEARWFTLDELAGADLALSLNVVEVARQAATIRDAAEP
ncbi:NUDIX hydrolase [Pseudochelatococcus sp. B33]